MQKILQTPNELLDGIDDKKQQFSAADDKNNGNRETSILEEIDGLKEYNRFFYKKRKFLTLGDIFKNLKILNENELDRNAKIFNIRSLREAGDGDLSFLFNKNYQEDAKTTKANFCLIDKKYHSILPSNVIPLLVKNPHYASAVILDMFYLVPNFLINPGISKEAHIAKTAKIGANTEIQSGVYIEEDVVIGDNCKICANATIGRKCVIGDGSYVGANSSLSYCLIGKSVVLQNNVSIGQCGFGFVPEDGFNYKIPQIGVVEIGDFVEIGAGTTIDRSAQDKTIIGMYTKIDNLVHIAHGVHIGMGCFMAAQVGIAGSTTIGNYVQMGGKAGIAGHLKIDDLASIAANAGVMKNVGKGEIVGGSPAMLIREWHRTTILLKKLLNSKGSTES